MTKITSITAYAATRDLGANVTEADAAGYRQWLAAQLAAAYPNAEIDVANKVSTSAVDVDTEDGADDVYAAEAEVAQFVERAWERCGWEWVR